VWQEFEYPFDVCRFTRGAHIEHLKLSKKIFFSFLVAVNNSIKIGPLVFFINICNHGEHYDTPRTFLSGATHYPKGHFLNVL
jgi:hypothetical protein